ncbi:MAG: catalase [Erysipelotrichaceae bacterium]|nr:catalase [Erysipelotrichaceae bacterium]
MDTVQRFFRHLHTVNKHRFLVMKMCFSCGMYKQGLMHDLSKYSLTEFIPSVRYYQGNRSPISKEKEVNGYSQCWLHHKGRNRHHWEYWVDRENGKTNLICLPMPFEYLLESVLDRISASKTYNKGKYTDAEPYEFFLRSKEYHTMNQKTASEIARLLLYLKENGEKKALRHYRDLYRQYKKDRNFTLESQV